MKTTDYNKLADIEAKNARFKKASKSRKRVMIARDVLAQLGTRLIAKPKVWVEDPNILLKNQRTSTISAPSQDTEVCDITSKLKTCNVYGIGALFVSAVEFADKLKVKDLEDYYGSDTVQLSVADLWDYLGQYFSKKQLNMIECAFEKGAGQIYPEDADYSNSFLCQFTELNYNPNERMRLIMENIVANKGEFVPAKLPVQKTIYVTPGYKG